MQPDPTNHENYGIPPDSVLKKVRELYANGLTVDAVSCAQSFAPLAVWRGAPACVIAARMAANSGAPRLAAHLVVRAFRTDSHFPEAAAFYGYELWSRRGPLAAWCFGESLVLPEPSAEILALRGMAAAELRDFSTAEKLISSAVKVSPSDPWIHLQRAVLLEKQDRVEEALAAADEAMRCAPVPWYRPAVQIRAELYQLLDRDDEAIRILREADLHIQNAPVAAQLYSLLSENNRWEEAWAVLDRFENLAVLLEPEVRNKWLVPQRSRAAYHLGRYDEASRLASGIDDAFHRRFARNLALSNRPLRICLKVTFVRQHFKTCAPATLAALGTYWKLPTEHLKLAEAICYDGTPLHTQRTWAESHGWHVREFRLTMDAATALLEKNIPFAVSTVDPGSAHMMAVIGCDRLRGTLLFRDPGQPYVIEMDAEEFLERYRPFGPHAVVFIPSDQAALLDGLEFPDAAAYYCYHAFSAALARHDHAAARRTIADMEDAFSDHDLTWMARLDLGIYEGNQGEQRRCLERMLERYPHSAAWRLRRLACCESRMEQFEVLNEACADAVADPALLVERARLWAGDARFLDRARRDLKRTYGRFMGSGTISAMADISWESGAFDQAVEAYRFAACLEAFREDLFQRWFTACRRTGLTHEAMTYLEDRFTRYALRSEQPALTLAWAWNEIDQPDRARDVLEQSMRLRPDDGGLLLRSAQLFARMGDEKRAENRLAEASGRVRKNDWLRVAAEIAENNFRTEDMLRYAGELIAIEPLALDAHGATARALARLKGPQEAQTYLAGVCADHPRHYGLARLRAEWTRNEALPTAEESLLTLLRIEPSDAWSYRELALIYLRQNKLTEALRQADEAERIEPRNTYSYSVRGRVLLAAGKKDEAVALYRRAIGLSVDNTDAAEMLIANASTDQERRERLAYIESELIRQVVTGDGVLMFHNLARPLLNPQALLDSARQAKEARSDLWHTWVGLARQLSHLGVYDEALKVAEEAVRRFPYIPLLWLELSSIRRWRKEPEAEIEAAGCAFDMNPSYTLAAVMLADALERNGSFDRARGVLERAIAHAPHDAPLRARYAALVKRVDPETAFAALERALRLSPDLDAAWRLYRDMANETSQTERVADFARTLCRERPGEYRTWLTLARLLQGGKSVPEQIEAIDRAMALAPSVLKIRDLKAELLTEAGRFEEAIQVCREGETACTGDVFMLQGRRAWIESQRNRIEDAIFMMQKVLERNAGYTWGWLCLTTWLAEVNRLERAMSATREIIRLLPHASWPLVRLAWLYSCQGMRRDAITTCRDALSISPDDEGAIEGLFELAVAEGLFEDARYAVDLMLLHHPGGKARALQIKLWLRQKKNAEARREFAALCRSHDVDDQTVAQVTVAFKKYGRFFDALGILREAVHDDCHPSVGKVYIKELVGLKKPGRLLKAFLKMPSPAAESAVPILVEGLTKENQQRLLRRIVQHRGWSIRRDDAAWDAVAYAMSFFKRTRDLVAWMNDWKKRQTMRSGTLFNYCLALRNLDRRVEAEDVIRYARARWERLPQINDLNLFLAIEEALTGEPARALALLETSNPRADVPYDRMMKAMVKTLAAFRAAPEWERRGSAGYRGLSLQFTMRALVRANPDVRRTFIRAALVVTRQGGGVKARLWFGFKLMVLRLRIPTLVLAACLTILLAIKFPLTLILIIPLLLVLLAKGRRKK